MTEQPQEPQPSEPQPDEPDPNLITTHSFGEEQSPVQEDDAEKSGQ